MPARLAPCGHQERVAVSNIIIPDSGPNVVPRLTPDDGVGDDADRGNGTRPHAPRFNGGPRRPIPLLQHHRAELRASGLTDETIIAAGIYSEVSPQALAEILHWSRPPRQLPPAIVFPYHGTRGPIGYSRIKADNPRQSNGSPVKYESPRGLPNEIYLPPNTIGLLADTNVPLIITEGEKKALAADQHDHPCVGLVGAFGWKAKGQETLLPSLEHIAWRGRDVFIVFDSDIRHKADVQDAETRLAAMLVQRGANVKVVRLSDGPPDEEGSPGKIGLDDYLVTHGPCGLRELLEEAEAPTEPTAAQMKMSAKTLDPCTTVGRFIQAHKQDGLPIFRFWRDDWYQWSEGYYRQISDKDLRGRIVRHINDAATHLTSTIVTNMVEQLRAQSWLADDLMPPTWLGEGRWEAGDVVAFRNGLVSLSALVGGSADYQAAPTPNFFTTVAADYDFTPDAPRPDRWLNFLSELWPDDPQSIETLQDWCGYALTTDTSLQKILLMIGPKRSGKGTVCRVLRKLIGERNVVAPTLASLGTNFGLSALLDKSLAIVGDARLGNRTDKSLILERLLSISGEDAQTIDRKYRELLTTRLTTRFMLLSNELPDITDQSGAFSSRMILLRFIESWYGRENTRLTNQLLGELPGIVLWAIRGWQRLRERGHLVEPRSCADLRRTLDDLVSPVAAFVRDQCRVGSNYSVPRKDLYSGYRSWCMANGSIRVDSNVVFGRNLRAVVATIGDRQHNYGDRAYTGIELRSPNAVSDSAQQATTG